ncbi:hypothetical protein ABTN10_19840, partial [Acinetobacter baumannii]
IGLGLRFLRLLLLLLCLAHLQLQALELFGILVRLRMGYHSEQAEGTGHQDMPSTDDEAGIRSAH